MKMTKNPVAGVYNTGVAARSGMSVFILALIVCLFLAGCLGGGGSVPKPPGYHASGVGVILQSKGGSDPGVRSAKSLFGGSSRKRIDFSPGVNPGYAPKGTLRATGVAADVLTHNVTYLVLAWDPVPNATHYRIFYLGNEVWDSSSSATHAGDPAYDPNNPRAYLDLDDELKDENITQAGEYPFQITALDSHNTVVVQLPEVTVSLGMLLDNFPTSIACTSGSSLLTWTGVGGAAGYKVRIYSDANYGTMLSDSGTAYLTGTSYDLTGQALTAGAYYGVIVDAAAVSAGGQPLEIMRGIGGFTD